MSYCSSCGTKLEDGQYFCPQCGAPKQISSYSDAITAALSGVNEGYEYLYNNTVQNQYNIVISQVNDAENTNKIIYDSYLKAWNMLATLNNPELFPQWIASIVFDTTNEVLQSLNHVHTSVEQPTMSAINESSHSGAGRPEIEQPELATINDSTHSGAGRPEIQQPELSTMNEMAHSGAGRHDAGQGARTTMNEVARNEAGRHVAEQAAVNGAQVAGQTAANQVGKAVATTFYKTLVGKAVIATASVATVAAVAVAAVNISNNNSNKNDEEPTEIVTEASTDITEAIAEEITTEITTEEISVDEEELLLNYLTSTLVPELGYINEDNGTLYVVDGVMTNKDTAGIGIMSAQIDDFNNDDNLEMIVFYCTRADFYDEPYDYTYNVHAMNYLVCNVVDGAVIEQVRDDNFLYKCESEYDRTYFSVASYVSSDNIKYIGFYKADVAAYAGFGEKYGISMYYMKDDYSLSLKADFFVENDEAHQYYRHHIYEDGVAVQIYDATTLSVYNEAIDDFEIFVTLTPETNMEKMDTISVFDLIGVTLYSDPAVYIEPDYESEYEYYSDPMYNIMREKQVSMLGTDENNKLMFEFLMSHRTGDSYNNYDITYSIVDEYTWR